MKLAKLLFVFTLLLVGGDSFAQNAEVHGIITDAKSNEPLQAIVQVGDKGVSADLDGKYSLTLPAGIYTAEVKFIGYTTIQKSITLKSGESMLWNIQMENMSNDFRVVVISAGKYEQDAGEVTVSMEVIKPKLFEDKNIASVEEGLQQAPGVAIVDDEPQIRSGSGYSFGAGSRVQVLIDDLPVLSGDAGKPSWGFLPMENISQVEIIKGASSVLYGSSALSGVINFRTAYPTLTPTVKLQAWQGAYSNPANSAARYWGRNNLKSGLNFLYSRQYGNVDFVLGTSLQADEGHLGPVKDSLGNFDNGAFNPMNVNRYDGENRARVSMNLRVRSKKIKGLNYGVNGIFSQGTSYATLIWENDSTGLYSAYEGSATKTVQLLTTLDPFAIYYGKKGAKHSLRTRWQSLDNANDNNQGNFSDVLYGEYQYQQNWESYGIENLITTTGVVAVDTKARGELFTGGNPDGRNTAGNRAIFFQVDKKFFNRLNLSAGVRYEEFQINNEKQGKPVFRAGANYKMGQATFVRASYGEGFRFPSIAEKFIVTSLGAVKVFANPSIKAETSYNAELGIKQGFKLGSVQGFADVAVFQQEFKNFIEFTFGQWDPNPTFDNMLGLGFKSVNTGQARVRGVDFSLMGEAKWNKSSIQFLAGYTYTQPVSTTPNDVYATAPVDASNPFLLRNFANATYTNTSSDAANNILKYRLQHLIRVDVGATIQSWSVGASVRANSHMQNIDGAFETLEKEFPTVFNPGIIRWRQEHKKGDFVIDARLGYNINPQHKVAIVASNILNRVYAIRPLALEDSRLILVQYSFSLHP